MSDRFNLNDYVPVQERIVRFWNEHSDGSIVTRLMSPPDDFGQCRYEATVYKHRDDARASATGYAFETAGGRGPNSTSHEENCETSAIGRALANMGYATSHATRPSREEMGKVAAGASPVDRSVDPGRTEPPRDKSTTTNTAANVPVGDAGTWTGFWKQVEAAGLARDKAALEKMMGQSLGADPEYALERFRAWRKDMAEQKALA